MAIVSNTTTHDVFISYAEADRAWVNGFLLDALDEAGASVHSEDAFALGVPRLVEFERAIQQSRRTMLILSPAYLADTFGQFVDVLANSYGMETATWPVIPLILQPVALPPRLSQLQPLQASTPEAQQAALVRLCAELKRPVPGPAPLPDCPYPGMLPFDEADSDRFFGREQAVQDLVDRLRLHPFLAVIGASGSGKSSLVRAGLLPALRKNRSFGSGDWLVRTFRPGETPLDTLAETLGAARVPPAPPSIAPAADDLLSMLLITFNGTGSAGSPATNGQTAATPSAANDLPFAAASAATALLSGTPAAQRLLLVVDQFEEAFTVANEQAAQFQQALLQLAATPSCYVVLTVRADFYADLMASPLWEQIQSHRVEVAPLGEADLRRAIVRPAEQAGVAVEAALVERLTADAAGEPGVLPLVQETLVLLWERLERRFLPMRAYEALVLSRSVYGGQEGGEPNGLQVAIARRADATLASLAEAQQPIARRIFLRLIQFGEGRADTRRQQPVTALRSAGDDPALFEATLHRLAESRLLTLSGAENREPENQRTREPHDESRFFGSSALRFSARVDIAHEALIRGWPALQGWLSERREGEQTRRRLADKAAEWVRLGRTNGGLLDAIELLEAERWLQSPDADAIGFDQSLPELVAHSRAAIKQAAQEREAARRHELAQAQALAEEQTRRAEEQAAASKRLRQRAIGLSVALMCSIILAVIAGISYRNAVQKTRQARAGELVAQSELAGDTFPQRGLLLALEALHTIGTGDAAALRGNEQALRNALARAEWRLLDDQIVPFGTASSADGHFFAASHLDGVIAIRDMHAADPTTPVRHVPSLGGALSRIALSDDGHLLAGLSDTTLRVWDLPDGGATANVRLQIKRPTNRAVISLSFSPHRRWLMIETLTSLYLWDLQATDASASIRQIDFKGFVVSPCLPITCSFSADDRMLAMAVKRTNVELYDLSAATLENRPASLPAAMPPLAFSPDGRWLATAGVSQTIRLWDVAALKAPFQSHRLTSSPQPPRALAFSPDSRWLVAAGAGITAWDMATAPAAIQQLALADGDASALFFGANEPQLAAGMADGTIEIWNINQGFTQHRVLTGQKDSSLSIRFSADGQTLLSARHDRTVWLWNLAAADPNTHAIVLPAHDDTPVFMDISRDQRTAITYSRQGVLRAWDLNDRASVIDPDSTGFTLSAQGRWAMALTAEGVPWIYDLAPNGASHRAYSLSGSAAEGYFSADGTRLAVASREDQRGVWHLQSTAPTFHPLPAGTGKLLAFSGDGSKLATNDLTNTLTIWDVRADPPIAQTITHVQTHFSASFSQDGGWLAGVDPQKMLIWNVSESPPTLLQTYVGTFAGDALAFSPDRRYLATPSADQQGITVLEIDRAGTVAQRRELHGSAGKILQLMFSPTSSMLLSISGRRSSTGLFQDITLHLWDVRTFGSNPQSISLPGFDGALKAFSMGGSPVAFSADGSSVVAIEQSGQFRQWALPIAILVDQACAIVGRNVSWEEWQQYFPGEPYRQSCPNVPPHPSYIAHLFEEAGTHAKQGMIARAIAKYAAARKLAPDDAVDATYWNTLCRAGILWEQLNLVQDACGRAVAQAPDNAQYRDSRGLSRALTGDSSGAIEDFYAYIDWANEQDAETNKAAIAQHEAWIAVLQNSGQPINRAVLKELREAERQAEP